MTGSWEIKFPPPLSPVQPRDRVKDRKPDAKQPRREHDKHVPERHEDDDDTQPHIDDYA